MSGTTQARDTLEAPPTSAMDMAKIVQERDQLRMLDKERRKTMMQQVPRMCSLTRYLECVLLLGIRTCSHAAEDAHQVPRMCSLARY